MSIHHALLGILSIHAGNRLGHTALSAGWDSFANGLLEAATCIAERPDEPVILVHGDDKLPPDYDAFREPDDAELPFVAAIALVAPAARPTPTSRSNLPRPWRGCRRAPAWRPISSASFYPTQPMGEAADDGHSGSGVVLPRQLDFAWRVIGTGLGFVVFLGGGSLLAVVAFPVIDLVTPEPSQRRERYHALMRWAFRAFVGMLHGLRVIEVEIDDPVALRGSKGVIVVANHPTLIDIVLLSAFIPRAQCIVKRELWDSPFLGRLMRGSGYIPNDLEPEALVAACRAALADGRSLIVFPEGTRSRPGMKLHFHRGFAQHCDTAGGRHPAGTDQLHAAYPNEGREMVGSPLAPPAFQGITRRLDPGRQLAKQRLSFSGGARHRRRVERLYNEQLASRISGERDQRTDRHDAEARRYRTGGDRYRRIAVRRRSWTELIDALEIGVALRKRYAITIETATKEVKATFAMSAASRSS